MDTTGSSYLLGLVLSNGLVKVTSASVLHFALTTKVLDALRLPGDCTKKDTHAGQELCLVTNEELTNLFVQSVSLPECFEEDTWHFMNVQKSMGLNDSKLDKLPFVKGVIEGGFWCHLDTSHPRGGVVHYSRTLMKYVATYLSEVLGTEVHVVHDNTVMLSGINLLDALFHFQQFPWNTNPSMQKAYHYLSSWKGSRSLTLRFKKTVEHAVEPFKSRASDSGWDLTLVQKVKEVNGVEFFDTGIVLEPPLGYYFDLVPRSSLSKTGYMLANSVGVIDRGYRSSVLVPLVKVHKDAPDLQLPFRAVQIIPRHIVHMETQEVQHFSESTCRNTGGFGSTNH
jgi:deoxyuridine 5'-triphosphate nucleotidohydrolase